MISVRFPAVISGFQLSLVECCSQAQPFCRGINGLSCAQGQDGKERARGTVDTGGMRGCVSRSCTRLRGQGRGRGPASLPQWDAAPKLEDVRFISSARENIFLRACFPAGILLLFHGISSGAELPCSVCWCLSCVCHTLPPATLFSFLSPTRFLCEEGAGCAPGSMWGRRVIQACC